MGSEATKREPMPTGDGEDVTSRVVTDLMDRSAVGAIKYGTRLKTNNGRDALTDAYQEALDLCCYLKQAIMERGENAEDK